MKLIFAERAWEDYLHQQKTDCKLLDRINILIREISVQTAAQPPERPPNENSGPQAAVERTF